MKGWGIGSQTMHNGFQWYYSVFIGTTWDVPDTVPLLTSCPGYHHPEWFEISWDSRCLLLLVLGDSIVATRCYDQGLCHSRTFGNCWVGVAKYQLEHNLFFFLELIGPYYLIFIGLAFINHYCRLESSILFISTHGNQCMHLLLNAQMEHTHRWLETEGNRRKAFLSF